MWHSSPKILILGGFRLTDFAEDLRQARLPDLKTAKFMKYDGMSQSSAEDAKIVFKES